MKTSLKNYCVLIVIIASSCLTVFANPFQEIAAEESGWKYSEWYGWIHDEAFPWIYHLDHDWQYLGPDDTDGLWIYDRVLGWIWTSGTSYPSVFSDFRQAWMAFQSTKDDTRTFYEHAIKDELEYPKVRPPWISKNHFLLHNSQLDTDDIIEGGPFRDGIPALLEPKFVSQAEAESYMLDDDIIISVTHNGTTRAYPFRILNYHEIANDEIDGYPITVTYCPLCGTAMVFERVINGREMTFGVSGLLYRDNMLMYDHQTDSLWNQLALESQTGPMFKTRLKWIPSQQMRYSTWKDRFPDSMVLSADTGHDRNYDVDPYTWVPGSFTLTFVPYDRQELAYKAWVYGILINEQARAYPLEALESGNSFTETFQGVELDISFSPEASEVTIIRRDTGQSVPVVQSFWITWQGFYPETTIYGF